MTPGIVFSEATTSSTGNEVSSSSNPEIDFDASSGMAFTDAMAAAGTADAPLIRTITWPGTYLPGEPASDDGPPGCAAKVWSDTAGDQPRQTEKTSDARRAVLLFWLRNRWERRALIANPFDCNLAAVSIRVPETQSEVIATSPSALTAEPGLPLPCRCGGTCPEHN